MKPTAVQGWIKLRQPTRPDRIGHDPVVFARIKAGRKIQREICRMPDEESGTHHGGRAQQTAHAGVQKMKAPLTEWVRTWDMDEFGRLPTSTEFLKAEAQRAALSSNVRRGGRGEASVSQAAGLSNTQWTEISPDNVGGRLRAILIDPRQSAHYVSAATGGVCSENADSHSGL